MRAESSTPPRVLRCWAVGKDGEWEAICLDLDIAVQGESFEEVSAALEKAIRMHVETVMTLPKEERPALLDRPVPLGPRLRFALDAFRFALRRRSGGPFHHHYTMPLPA